MFLSFSTYLTLLLNRECLEKLVRLSDIYGIADSAVWEMNSLIYSETEAVGSPEKVSFL